MYMWVKRQVWLSHSLGVLTAPLFSPLCPHVFADQLNSTGLPQLPSLHLVPEEVESEEGEDYY